MGFESTLKPVHLAAHWAQRGLGLTLTTIALIAARDLPRWGTELFVGASLYLLALIRFPRVWILLLPAFVVTVDLAPWTGRFLYNELDVILWLTIAAALICGRYSLPARNTLSREQLWILSVVVVFSLISVAGSSGVSAIICPPGPLFDSPYLDYGYGYNVFKGLVWAVLLTPLWIELRKADAAATLRCLFLGAVAGSLALLCVIFWERGSLAAFALGLGPGLDSLANLSTQYRTIGLFSNMRTGGEALDGTIILLLSVCSFGAFYARPLAIAWWSRIAVIALAYVTLVGFTRATYAAFALSLSLLILLEVYRYRTVMRLRLVDVFLISTILPGLCVATYLEALLGTPLGLALLVGGEAVILILFAQFWLRWHFRRALLPAGGMILVALMFALGLTANTMGTRMQSVDKSLDTRLVHWMNVWEIGRREPGLGFLGQGAGSFPGLYRKYFPEEVSRVGAAVVEPGAGVLRLEGDGDLLLAQRLTLSGRKLQLEFSVRGREGGLFSVALCPRNILDIGWWQGRCDTQTIELNSGADFKVHRAVLVLPDEAGSGEAANWPRALQFRNLDVNRPIEITAIRSVAGLSAPLINGSFYQGMDGWFFSTDFGHLPFHIKNTWLQFWFDQGWLGLILIVVMMSVLVKRAINSGPGEVVVPMAALAAVSFGALGMFGTPLDSARVAWLFYLLLFAGLFDPTPLDQPSATRDHW